MNIICDKYKYFIIKIYTNNIYNSSYMTEISNFFVIEQMYMYV